MFTELRAGNFDLKKYGFYGLFIFYALAGLNHFIMPEFYYPLIPDYFHDRPTYNAIAGLAEIVLAFGIYYRPFRRASASGIILLLLTFVSSHVYMIQEGGCIPESLCVPLWVAWVRLVLIHPLLMFWAWAYRDYKLKTISK
ncbi:MAG: hypothetical protein RIC95_05985 [Vicingaceae bacterium]